MPETYIFTYPEHFNPCLDSTGMHLYEHWEEPIPGSGEYNLLAVAATPHGMSLEPGDWILQRRWAPASEPELINRARHPIGDNDA